MTRRADRLALFAPNLSGGGAERTLARLATHWADQGREVTVVTLAEVSPDDFPLSSSVRRVGLGLTADSGGLVGAVRNNLRRVGQARAAFRDARPEVVVSFIEQANVLALLAARPLGVPVVIGERTDPARHPVSRLWSFLRRRAYPRCAALVVLTDEIAQGMRRVVRGRPVVVVPNGIAPAVVAAAQERSRIVLGVGRLENAKGFDRLVDAFAAVASRNPDWTLVIVGEGPQREMLERLIAEKGLAGRVHLPGRTVDPSEWYARAGLFALPSRYEGFPNALLEAMSHGLPAVAFDGPAAVRKVIRDGIDGCLARDGEIGSFAEAVGDLIADEDRRRRMGVAAREVVSRFSLADSLARWDAVVDAAAAGDFSQVSGTERE